MANSIALFKQYTTILDEVLCAESKTSVLDGSSELVKAGKNANELVIQKISMDGALDYNKQTGAEDGDVIFENETVKCNYDRGRGFLIDVMDNQETAGMAFVQTANQFIRTKIVPELDAFRLSTYASAEGVMKVEGSLTTGAQVLAELRKMVAYWDDKGVPENERYVFITATHRGLVEDLDTTKSRAVLEKLTLITTPQNRLYTAIKMNKTKADNAAGGYTKAEDGKNINFIGIQKDAAIQFQKHVAPKVLTPDQQKADGFWFSYRNVGIADVYENKVDCIYVHADVQ